MRQWRKVMVAAALVLTLGVGMGLGSILGTVHAAGVPITASQHAAFQASVKAIGAGSNFWDILQYAFTIFGWFIAAHTLPVGGEEPIPASPTVTFSDGSQYTLEGLGGTPLAVKRLK